ncbi:MAG: helix-turn-helix transcriptional regulator [Henriciella sp.]|uniref:helix-turn-helix transcriptional regulator n=1 Tax=Henriciella sp. TaxID=1968823 RepID=UPI000C0FE5B8|nr:LuxR C-terminal-related transcriptional regulator [Henriciella sp.]MAN74842.1 helix-turn-helix transcriptional regulator [Henriciella sp.]MBF34153.1 helix-turn-helix transcriptional regulator [Hyphomonadaceae bacterium]PHR81971.1 MAG: helix-turn-helix transcriptional regulator [Henriciella sp.]|tara:strand:- start:547 stop:1293 length:747 start_codon:yes stop_codon:yes gene_type:complete
MPGHGVSLSIEDRLDILARQVAEKGEEIGLPYIAVSADISSTDPMRDREGEPFAETVFKWLDPSLEYWKDRMFALRSTLVHATRTCAEPFYYAEGEVGSWRPNAAVAASNDPEEYLKAHIQAAIVAPAYLPGGAIGAVAWASDQPQETRAIFERHAESLHALALKFIATYHDARSLGPQGPAVYLTRREIQCLKWASAGKTDAEIATIMHISVPTVRFHITNSATKLGVAGKARAIQRASTLGYIGHD